MEKWELGWTEEVEGVLEFLRGEDLVMEEMGVLTKAGARHWHFRKPGAKGCLELTWWPKVGRFWLSLHGNRGGDWVMGVVDRVCEIFGARND